MKNTIMFSKEIIDVKLSNISVVLSIFNIDDTIEQKFKTKYHISNSIITGKLISIIAMIIKTPKEFFIIKKLLNTDESASPTPPPTIGINAPEINLMPLSITLSDELARILCVVRRPVKIVENRERIIINNLFIVFIILVL